MTPTKSRRPTRGDLLGVISYLQQLVGRASEGHYNDRDPNGFEKAQKCLHEAERLCVMARSADSPRAGDRSKLMQRWRAEVAPQVKP